MSGSCFFFVKIEAKFPKEFEELQRRHEQQNRSLVEQIAKYKTQIHELTIKLSSLERSSPIIHTGDTIRMLQEELENKKKGSWK